MYALAGMPVSASHAPACSMASGRSPRAEAIASASSSGSPGTRRCKCSTLSTRVKTSTSNGAASCDHAGFREVMRMCPCPSGRKLRRSFGSSALSKISSQRLCGSPRRRVSSTEVAASATLSPIRRFSGRARSARSVAISSGCSADSHQIRS